MLEQQTCLYRLALIVLGSFAVFAGTTGLGQDNPQTFLLNGTATATAPEQGIDSTTATSDLVAGKRVVRLTDVTIPTATWYPAGQQGASVPAMLVLPGGGYQVLATDLEGSEVCAWLNKLGISALLLRYRVPTNSPHTEPLHDAQAALSLLIARAAAWNVDAAHIGVIGFSAGAHLAARLDAAPRHERLAALMLIYPAYLQGVDRMPVGVDAPLSVPVTPSTPPLFLVQAQDDAIGVGNALGEYVAAAQNKVPAEMHLYATGGHGYGLRQTSSPVTHWTTQAADWLTRNGFAGSNAAVKP